ncbi:hypothetical protein GCM10010218_61600 [Streptomyces mashuensis]|uniref:Histidine kinase/HSP90-like ATPase domain-containing protein n=2 Tax=Streptomyces mashuensis TaxID=33904 RepID=A0A919B8K2_9ACTN|nr:hypothetical protein GCM10010218_61600 [Streptomyces mashuensis]
MLITTALVDHAAGTTGDRAPAKPRRNPVDRFAAALTEGLGRARAALPHTRAAVPPSTPVPGAVLGRHQAEETLRRFREALDDHLPGYLPGQPHDGESLRQALLGLAHLTVRRLAGDRDAGTAQPLPGVSPDQLVTASLLLAECAVRSGSTPADVLPDIREVFAPAAREIPAVRDVWQERRALARDVHDRVSGPLTAALRQLQGTGATGSALVEQVLTRAADGARDIVDGLHRSTPVAGLYDATQDVRALGEARGVAVSWALSGDESTLPELFRHELSLVTREAMLNAFTHASAHQVAVRARITRKWAHAQIRDDGSGFDVAHTLASRPAHGLRAMSERMESVGGRLAITSTAGSGTRVDVHLPRYYRPS